MSHRMERVNRLIREGISELLQREVKDPRLGSFVIVNEVIASADLRHARIFVSGIVSEAEKQAALSALVAASGFFRRELSQRLRLRRMPELSFQWDDSIEHGAHLLQLIDQVTAEDTPG